MPQEAPSEIEARLAAVERLSRIFRIERFTYLAVCVLALVALFYVLAIELVRGTDEASWGEALMLLGPSGLITYSGARILHVWTQSMRLIAGETLEGSK